MRTFIAFPTSEDVKAELVRIQSEIIRYNPKLSVKWTEDFNLHVTVEFLGEITATQIDEVQMMLRAVCARQQSFNYWLEDIGVFPDEKSPRVLMIKLRESRMQSMLIHDEIKHELDKMRITTDKRSWVPHLTLGRLKSESDVPIILKQIEIMPSGWLVDKMEIIKSELTPGGSLYTVLEQYKFSDISASFTLLRNYLNKKVKIIIDRPIGSTHSKYKFTYEANYGYVPKTMAPDGEEIDAYFLGVDKPVSEAEGRCIAIIHRFGDDDDKLVVVPEGVNLTDEEIKKSTYFQEQWFKNRIYRG